ncbi:MAG: DUF308 domain-containing protein [Treponema sp.]|nr:DUF308 domain-containing protein [Candidatus Treponema merdequi]
MITVYLIPALTAVIGLVMLCSAEAIISVFVIALGVFMLISGIYLLFTMPKYLTENSLKIGIYVRGGLSIILGLLCIILPVGVVNFSWKVMMIILGIYALCSAALEIFTFVRMTCGSEEKKHFVIEIIGTLIGAIVLFMLPSNFGFTLIRIAGGIFILIAIIQAINIYRNRDIVEEDAPVKDE